MKALKLLTAGLAIALLTTGCDKKEEAKTQAPVAQEKASVPAQQQSSAFAAGGSSNPEGCADCGNAQTDAKHKEGCTDCNSANAKPAADMKAVGIFKVADLFAKKAELNGKVVEVKGEVVKVSSNIMGRYWIHIQDGSGKEGTNDIIFTAPEATVQKGDKVTAKGVLAMDKDFGYGYFYSAIVENSVFSK
ncbi:MAG: hypothetical protein QG567_1388 [Campylobacterota bacterium]|nr:hypothetical protein [Campylobacterota bacterium]